jgi:hypothetical protein
MYCSVPRRSDFCGAACARVCVCVCVARLEAGSMHTVTERGGHICGPGPSNITDNTNRSATEHNRRQECSTPMLGSLLCWWETACISSLC